MVILAVPFRVFACGGKVRERAGEAGTEEPEGGLNSGHIHPYSFTYLLNKYLLSTDCLPGTVTGTVGTAMIKTDVIPAL